MITIGCHHPGSIALLDSETHFLFTGDELESGQVLLGSGGPEKIALHKANMEKLYARIDEISMVCPAHNGSPLSKEYIHDYLVLDGQILDGTAQVMPNTAGYGYGPTPRRGGNQVRVQNGGASIVYEPWDQK